MRPLALLLLSSCSQPLPLVLSNGNVQDEMPEWVEDVCALLELECVLEDDDGLRGKVMVFTTPNPQHGTAGQVLANGACRKAVWVVEGASVGLAHELGHVFGLEHVDDEVNVMFEKDPGDELTEDQLDDVHRRAGRFVSGCP